MTDSVTGLPPSNVLLAEILLTLKGRYPNQNQTWGCQPVLTAISSKGQPMMLFFTAEYAAYNKFPSSQFVRVPSHPFRFMILLNEGNCDIMFDTNYKPNNFPYSCLLRAQEDMQLEAKGDDRIWSFAAMAMPAGGPNPTLNATNWDGDATTAHLRILAVV
jgi:hypothetical protein